ncbi:MAG: putative glycoside hydrolase [Saccharofermentanales bacterium]
MRSSRKQRRRRRIRQNITFVFVFLILLVTIILVITNCKNFIPGKSSDASSLSSSLSGDSLVSSAQSASDSSVPSSTPTLSASDNNIVGRFFGALVPVANPKEVKHNELRALYIGSAGSLDKNIEIANNSEINAFVIDLKESNGIYFNSTNKLANEIGAVKVGYNLVNVVKKCKDNNIKVIGRIVCFKDHILSAARPDLCIKDKSGNLLKYPLEGNKTFINAYDKEVWQYNIDIAKEAISLGVDEIQFDYVRFPTCNPTIRAAEHFGPDGTVPTKIEAITRYLQTAKIEIQDGLGIPLSGDIYGIVLTSKLDGRLIGQDWEILGHLGLDTLSPMIYPSHYAKNTRMYGIVFPQPSADTYKFLDAVFKQELFSETPGFSHVRCYIQAYDYTQAQIFGQIQALQKHGFSEYIYWNAKATYSISNVKQ